MQHRPPDHPGRRRSGTPGKVPGEIMRWLVAGAGGLAVSLVVTALMHEGVGLPEPAAFAIAVAVLFGLHFLSSAYFVFRSGADGRMFLRYTIAALAFRGLDFVLFVAISGLAPLYAAVVLAMAISNVCKFFVYRHHVFRSDLLGPVGDK